MITSNDIITKMVAENKAKFDKQIDAALGYTERGSDRREGKEIKAAWGLPPQLVWAINDGEPNLENRIATQDRRENVKS